MKRSTDWMTAFAESELQKMNAKKNVSTDAKPKMRRTASKRAAAKKDVTKSDVLVMSRDKLPGVTNGKKVRYNNTIWRVVNANYKDALGTGVAMVRVASIDNKNLTDPETRARVDPGNVYDYDVRDTTEVPDFQAAAAKTEQDIAASRAHDFTTPAGRVTDPAPTVATFDDVDEGIDVASAPAPAVEPAAKDVETFDDVDEGIDADVAKPAVEPAAKDVETFDDVDEGIDAASAPAPAVEPAAKDVETFDDVDEGLSDESDEVDRKAGVYKTNPILKKIAGSDKTKRQVNKASVRKASIYKTNPILKKIVGTDKVKRQASKASTRKASIYKTNPILKKIVNDK